MNNLKIARFPLMAAVLVSMLGLSACTTVGYRCPLDPNEKSEYPTACSGMQDAIAGARKGTGGKTSVLMDDKGRLIPHELLENKPAVPLAGRVEPYNGKSGDPQFIQPKKFEVLTGAFVDAEGNLHDSHTAWFTTPGRWAYGTVDRATDVGNNTMRPALPDTRPTGRVVKVDPRTGEEAKPQAQAGNQAPKQNQQERDKAALQSLSSAAGTAAQTAKAQAQGQAQPVVAAKPAAAGVTAPVVGLGD